jgi:hypothetical protein
MTLNSQSNKSMFKVCTLFLMILTCVVDLEAQSLDPGSPAPVRTNNVLGKIAARDLGDARLTDHYYSFTGTPGDLLITVKSQNLNGDIDVFTAGSLRPLLKLTLYSESTAPITKGIYLRKREALVLRVEARSPNDDDGKYQLSFNGSFEPIFGGLDLDETETPAPLTSVTSVGGRKTKRVTSTGARIAEPETAPTEVATASTSEPSPEAKPAEAAPESANENPSEKSTAKPAPSRNPRTRRSASRRTTPTPAKPKEAAATATEKTEDPAAVSEPETSPKPMTKNSRRGASTVRAPKPIPEPEAETGPRLIIETNDGTLINRSMSGVRRVTVENGQVVVTGKDGKIDRLLLVNVVKMSIAP